MTDQKPVRNDNQPEYQQDTSVIGRYMMWIAWIIALALVAWLFQGELDQQWNPNENPETSTQQGRNTVTLLQNRYGHYITQGTINNEPVIFMLDTGATQVSIPSAVAKRLNLQRYGSARVNTANGSITVYPTKIDSLTIGNITLRNVSGHINPAIDSEEILLGMSALKRVEFTQSGKQLTLRE